MNILLNIFLWIILPTLNPVVVNPTVPPSSVAFFYGQDVPIPELCPYSWVVVDPASNFNPKEYCTTISQPFAYVSLGEVALDAPYHKDIKPEWVLGKNVAWNNNQVLDQTQKGWQDFFLDKLIEPLWQKGYHGFFLDTLDSYFLVARDAKEQQEQIEALVDVIQHIKFRHPDAKIILNRGFQLLPQVHKSVDAVVIESLFNAWNQAKRAYEPTSATDQKALLTEIELIRKMQLPIIIIDYLAANQAGEAPALANKLTHMGFIPWITDHTLQQIYIQNAVKVKREILVLYQTEHDIPMPFIAELRYMGTILEYMGYVPKYIDLGENKPLPSGDLSQRYSGIIVRIDVANPNHKALHQWIRQQIAKKIPVVFLNSFGVTIEDEALKGLNLITGQAKNSTLSLKVTQQNQSFIGFEKQPSLTPYGFFPLIAKNSQVLLQLQNSHQQTQDAVAITSWGGYALYPYVVQYLPNLRALWIINPFHFFRQALRLKDFPVPDVTTENGRRLMSVHIDGDGFSTHAKWIGGNIAAVELRDKILKKFRIPTSVSVITGEIAPNGVNPQDSPHLMDVARSIFSLPWVEIASHTFSHPFLWQPLPQKDLERRGESYTLNLPHYIFNANTEITGSVDFINQFLAPFNKKCHLFFWSGMANPTNETLALTYQDHLLNINGVSDTYIDNRHPSLTGIQPYGQEKGDHYQIFAPIDMDFFYMDGLGGPLYGFEKVIQTFQLTDQPRRFKPIDIYYHIYAASMPAALEALQKVYTWALKQPVMNIYISDYIRKVLDYYQITLYLYKGTWIIYSKADLREFRSSNDLGYPNLTKSQNVIGFNENKEDRYIHLGPSPLSLLVYQNHRPTEPFLVDANARVSFFSRTQHQLIIHFKGYTPLQFTLANTHHCTVTSTFPLKISPSNSVSKDRVPPVPGAEISNPTTSNTTYTGSKEYNEVRIDC